MTEGGARRKYGWALREKPPFTRLCQTLGHRQSFSTIASYLLWGINTALSFEGGVDAISFMHTIVNYILPTMNTVGQSISI